MTNSKKETKLEGSIFANITEVIGQTPVVRLNRLAPKHVEVFVKLEALNPGGSVKDRMALSVIEAAEREGKLKPGQTVIEATSGNTGIALAMVCAERGYPFVAVMAESFSVERRKLMRFYGAKVVLTPASERGSGMLAKVEELAAKHGWFMPRQFENEANAEVHSRTTAKEILADFSNSGLDYWVSGAGSGGTLKGVARVLKKHLPAIKIIAAEPDNSPLLSSGIAAAKNPDGSARIPHPSFRPHLMQGWSPDFLPLLAEQAIELDLIDEIIPVSGDDALSASRGLAAKEGILAGISGGATLAAALTVSQTAPKGSRILCMLPDTRERYLSTVLFSDISVHMTKEETEISKSTPGYRFDSRPSPIPISMSEPDPEPWAVKFIDAALKDHERGVLMFALEWCEFSDSARRMLRNFDIPFDSILLDSNENQIRGHAIRSALAARTGVRTIPQVFIGGDFIGGCSELFDSWKKGKLQDRLTKTGIPFNAARHDDPYSFFPTWLHPRE